MKWAAYLLFGLIIAAFIAVIIYWIIEKSKGHPILSDEPHLTKKQLIKYYKIQKKADEKRKAKEARKSLRSNGCCCNSEK